FYIPAFIPLLIAAALSSVISRLLYSEPLFILVTEGWVMDALFFYVLLALLSGFYFIHFNRWNRRIHHLFDRIKSRYNKIWVGGISLGILIALFPALYGEGYITIQQLLNSQYSKLLANSFFSGYQSVPWILLLFAF